MGEFGRRKHEFLCPHLILPNSPSLSCVPSLPPGEMERASTHTGQGRLGETYLFTVPEISVQEQKLYYSTMYNY